MSSGKKKRGNNEALIKLTSVTLNYFFDHFAFQGGKGFL